MKLPDSSKVVNEPGWDDTKDTWVKKLQNTGAKSRASYNARKQKKKTAISARTDKVASKLGLNKLRDKQKSLRKKKNDRVARARGKAKSAIKGVFKK